MYYWRSINPGWEVKINTWLAQPTSTQKSFQMPLSLHGIAPSYFKSLRHAHLFRGYNTRSRDFLPPPPPSQKQLNTKVASEWFGARTYNTLPGIIRQVKTLSEFKIKLPQALLLKMALYLLYLKLNEFSSFTVLMSLFLCCVRAPFKLALPNWGWAGSSKDWFRKQ